MQTKSSVVLAFYHGNPAENHGTSWVSSFPEHMWNLMVGSVSNPSESGYSAPVKKLKT